MTSERVMNLLILIHRLPCPADRGAKQRIACQLADLSERHDVWLAGYLDHERRDTESALSSLEAWKKRCRAVYAEPLRRHRAGLRGLRSLLSGRSATERYFDTPRLRTQITRWSRSIGFDAVLAFSSGMADLALSVDAPRHVLEFDDFDSAKWLELAKRARPPLRWVYRCEGVRLARREKDWLKRADAGVVVNQREVSHVNDDALRGKLHVIEPGIPLDVPWRNAQMAAPPPLSTEPVVTFVGAMDYAPNVDAACWFVKHVWPRILDQRPDARFFIVGRSPTREVRRLSRDHRVIVSGTVPEIAPYLEQSRVVVAPVRIARGIQIKVLMAMAAGRPCVVSPGVAEGIEARDRQEWLVAREPADFAESVLHVLDRDVLASRLGQAAWEFVRKHHRADLGSRKLERLLTGAEREGIPVLPLHPAGPERCAV